MCSADHIRQYCFDRHVQHHKEVHPYKDLSPHQYLHQHLHQQKQHATVTNGLAVDVRPHVELG